MKKQIMFLVKISLLLVFSLFVFGCATTSSTKGKYVITVDPAVTNPFVQSAWLAYTSHIRGDMEIFYKKNPEGVYTKPCNVEIGARNSMIEMYLRIRKDYEFQDEYIEDLIKIRSSNMLNEYVFFSFNTENWSNDGNYQEDKYKEWMSNNLPNHIPLTLAKIEKVD